MYIHNKFDLSNVIVFNLIDANKYQYLLWKMRSANLLESKDVAQSLQVSNLAEPLAAAYLWHNVAVYYVSLLHDSGPGSRKKKRKFLDSRLFGDLHVLKC